MQIQIFKKKSHRKYRYKSEKRKTQKSDAVLWIKICRKPVAMCGPVRPDCLNKSGSWGWQNPGQERGVCCVVDSQTFFFVFCTPSYVLLIHRHSSSSSSAFPAVCCWFTDILLCLLHSQLCVVDSQTFFFVFCIPSYVLLIHIHSSSSSAFPAMCCWFTDILLLRLLHSQLCVVDSHSSSSSSAFPAMCCWFTDILLLRLLHSQLCVVDSQTFFFILCIPSYVLLIHRHSSSSSPAFPQLCFVDSQTFFFFVFCIPSYVLLIHRHSSSSCAFPAMCCWFTDILLLRLLHSHSYVLLIHRHSSSSSSAFPAMCCWFTDILLLRLLHSQLRVVDSHSSSLSSAFPAMCCWFTDILLLCLLHSQLCVVDSQTFFFFVFCIPSCVLLIHRHSSLSSAFPAMCCWFTDILLRLLHSQLCVVDSQTFFFFFFCIPSYISGVHHFGWDFSAFPAMCCWFTDLLLLLLLHSQLYLWGSPFWVRFCVCDHFLIQP